MEFLCIKEKSIKRRKHENQKIPLCSLPFSHSFIIRGFALAGTSWLNSEFVNLNMVGNIYSDKMNVANFQFLFNLGLRMNLARPKKKDSDHTAQHGMELGVKIPTINTDYYSALNSNTEGSIACISIMCLLTRWHEPSLKKGLHCEIPPMHL